MKLRRVFELLATLLFLASLPFAAPISLANAEFDANQTPTDAIPPKPNPVSLRPVRLSLIKDIRAGWGSWTGKRTAVLGDTLFFVADDGVHYEEVWKSDGTEDGTIMVKDITMYDSMPNLLLTVNNLVYFRLEALGGLWRTDGSEAGTYAIRGDIQIWELAVAGDNIYFSGVTNGPPFALGAWKSDGTDAGTILLRSTCVDPGTMDFTFVNGTVFFATTCHPNTLWKSDGTPAGTARVKDLGGSLVGAYGPLTLEAYNGLLYFVGGSEGDGYQLWKSDGTTAGTVIVNPSISYWFYPQGLTVVGDTLFFSGNDPTYGRDLWKTDGTTGGTVQVMDINPAGSSNPQNLTDVGGTLYFTADDGTHGRELWKSDGTALGTGLVKDIHPTGSSNPLSLTEVDGVLFFAADDGTGDRELWMSDGSEAGTVRVADINPTGSSDPVGLTDVNGTLFLFPDDGVHGREPWKAELVCDFVAPPGMGIEDLQAIAGRWGQTSLDPDWDPLFDLDHDGGIDMVDIMRAAAAWGACLKVPNESSKLRQQVEAECFHDRNLSPSSYQP